MTKDLIDSAMKDLAEEARIIYGDKLKEVILFGSCARGDFEDDSDVDVMILVDVSKEEIQDADNKIDPAIHKLDRKYDFDLLFAPVVQSYEEFNYWLDAMPFFKSVRKEGIRYA